MTISARLRRQAAELLRLADELDAAAPPPAPSVAPAPCRTISIEKALTISGRSHSTIYRHARAHGFGRKTRGGSWSFDERALRAFYAARGEYGEDGECGDVNTTCADGASGSPCDEAKMRIAPQ